MKTALGRSAVSRTPIQKSPDKTYGGDIIVTCPRIYDDTTTLPYTAAIALFLGSDPGALSLTAQFLCDAINEKLDRDFTSGSG